MTINNGRKIYLSGPMSGRPNLNFHVFKDVAEKLRERNWEVVNPAELEPNQGAKWVDCMVKDIQELSKCDGIALLPGWEDSYGARVEKLVAEKLKLKIWSAHKLLLWGPQWAELE